jgi:hypothetical protein
LTVIFDDAITTPETIREALKKSDYPAEGEPEWLSR